jgi:hypothetical protein
VEFLKWGRHDDKSGFFRCRYRIHNGQGAAQVRDDWFFARDGQVTLHVTHLRRSKTDRNRDREELEKALKSLQTPEPPASK